MDHLRRVFISLPLEVDISCPYLCVYWHGGRAKLSHPYVSRDGGRSVGHFLGKVLMPKIVGDCFDAKNGSE